jgi:hypothetical protein
MLYASQQDALLQAQRLPSIMTVEEGSFRKSPILFPRSARGLTGLPSVR